MVHKQLSWGHWNEGSSPHERGDGKEKNQPTEKQKQRRYGTSSTVLLLRVVLDTKGSPCCPSCRFRVLTHRLQCWRSYLNQNIALSFMQPTRIDQMELTEVFPDPPSPHLPLSSWRFLGWYNPHEAATRLHVLEDKRLERTLWYVCTTWKRERMGKFQEVGELGQSLPGHNIYLDTTQRSSWFWR